MLGNGLDGIRSRIGFFHRDRNRDSLPAFNLRDSIVKAIPMQQCFPSRLERLTKQSPPALPGDTLQNPVISVRHPSTLSGFDIFSLHPCTQCPIKIPTVRLPVLGAQKNVSGKSPDIGVGILLASRSRSQHRFRLEIVSFQDLRIET